MFVTTMRRSIQSRHEVKFQQSQNDKMSLSLMLLAALLRQSFKSTAILHQVEVQHRPALWKGEDVASWCETKLTRLLLRKDEPMTAEDLPLKERKIHASYNCVMIMHKHAGRKTTRGEV